MRTIQRDIVGAVIESADGKILLAKNRKGGVYDDCFVCPGGGIEDGESREVALAREMREETGIDITGQTIVLIDDASTGESEKTLRDTGERVLVQMKFNDYHIRLDRNASEITFQEEDDLFGCQWFLKSELSGLKLSPPMQRLLGQIGYL